MTRCYGRRSLGSCDVTEPASSAPEAVTEPADDQPQHRYNAALAETIEQAWQSRWLAEGTFNAPNPDGPLSDGFDAIAIRPHAYVMDMFPYPSGAGLHVGHPLGYIGTDVYARYQRAVGVRGVERPFGEPA